MTPVVTWHDRRLLAWALAVGNLCLAMAAPVRPWGWAGAPLLGAAALAGLAAWRATRGVPGPRLWPAIVGAAAAYALAVRLLVYGGLAVA